MPLREWAREIVERIDLNIQVVDREAGDSVSYSKSEGIRMVPFESDTNDIDREVLLSVLAMQNNAYHELQTQILRLIRLLAAILVVLFTFVSISVSEQLGYASAVGNTTLYASRMTDTGLTTPNYAILSAYLGWWTSILSLSSGLIAVGIAVYGATRALQIHRLYPIFSVSDKSLTLAPSSGISGELSSWILHNRQELDEIATNLHLSYKTFRVAARLLALGVVILLFTHIGAPYLPELLQVFLLLNYPTLLRRLNITWKNDKIQYTQWYIMVPIIIFLYYIVLVQGAVSEGWDPPF